MSGVHVTLSASLFPFSLSLFLLPSSCRAWGCRRRPRAGGLLGPILTDLGGGFRAAASGASAHAGCFWEGSRAFRLASSVISGADRSIWSGFRGDRRWIFFWGGGGGGGLRRHRNGGGSAASPPPRRGGAVRRARLRTRVHRPLRCFLGGHLRAVTPVVAAVNNGHGMESFEGIHHSSIVAL
uniref:DUF3778 domain-containing protein n=1 Tax=Oryza glumipatula TaxID=40148 RepID=A0A0E0APK1_9ORYZ